MIGILVDVTKCEGCNACAQACVQANQLGDDLHMPQDVGDGLSANRWLSVVSVRDEKDGLERFVRKSCRHCLEAACVSVCPVGAMYKSELGPVLYDSERCMGCRYCMMACPFGIPRYEWDSAVPVVSKCSLCYDRILKGQQPACVEACPQEAIFGDRQELISIAWQKINAEPGKYVQHVYGEYEAGGTSVLYISDVPLDFLGFQGNPGEDSLPELTWAWLRNVKPISLATAGLMGGLFWVIGRRMQAEEKHGK